jgi:hypothetical protein
LIVIYSVGAIVSGLALAVAFGSAADAPKMSGFSADSAGKEWVIEQQFRSLVSTDRISKFHRYLTSPDGLRINGASKVLKM